MIRALGTVIVLLLLHYVCAPVAPPAVLTAIAMGFTLTLVRCHSRGHPP